MGAQRAEIHHLPDLSGLGRAITEHAPLPMALLEGADHVVRYANSAFCQLMGCAAEELLGKPFAETMPEEGKCFALLDRVYATGTAESYTEQLNVDRYPAFQSYTMWPLLTGDWPAGVMMQVTKTPQFHRQLVALNESLLLGSLRQHELIETADNLNAQLRVEIGERARAQIALDSLDRRKDEFLAMLSHELRNPLAPIINAVHLLRLQKDEDPVQQQARGIIERQVGQLTRLIDDLMEVSRLTSGRINLHMERLDLNAIVENAIETVRPLIDQQRHSFNVSMSPQPIWLYADAARLEQVVVNLLTNATKYTLEAGSVWLTVIEAGDEAVLRVRDSGVGIAPELLPHVFDLFTQGARTLDRSQGGLGIGLSLVQQLTQMHGGTVEVKSTLGEGSEFVLRLPITHVVAPPRPASSEGTVTTACSLRVLVVEDNADAAETLMMVLAAFGHDVRIAHDGLTAVEIALEFLPQVVLTDIGLPGLDGFEVAKRLRQQPALANAVLVAMTGYGEDVARQRSQEAGFDHHLVKPVDFDKIQAILAGVSAAD